MWIVGIIVFVLYLAAIGFFFYFLAAPVFVTGSAAMTVMVCVRYFQALGENLFWGDGAEEKPGGKEPAFYNYFFDKAWRDYARIIIRARDLMWSDARRVWGGGRKMMNAFGWPLGLTIWLVALVSAIPASINMLFLGILHVVIVVAAAVVVYVSAALLFVTERLSMAIRGIRGRCPECHQPLSLPVYVCACGAKHERLIPGAYGPIFRRCQCGRELPTLFLFGRNKLHSQCRVCKHELNTTVLTVPDVFIPIVGGVSSGKTSLITATLAEFEKKESGLSITFPKGASQNESVIQREYIRWRGQYMSGQRLTKTTDDRVRAVHVCLEDARGHKRLLYAYDAAGEIHRGEHALGTLPYYSYIHGLIFLVDPFSLTVQRLGPASPVQMLDPVSPSPDSPKQVFDQVVRSLISYSRRSSIASVPMAIAVTKTDAFGLRSRILSVSVPAVAGEKAPTPDELSSRAVRQWLLKNGGESLVNSAEQFFDNVRYFECSALGRLPETGALPFQARGVLELWAWILGEAGLAVNVARAGVAS